MKEEIFVAFIKGAMVTLLFITVILLAPHIKALSDCTKRYNVYSCEIQYVPVKEIE